MQAHPDFAHHFGYYYACPGGGCVVIALRLAFGRSNPSRCFDPFIVGEKCALCNVIVRNADIPEKNTITTGNA